MIDEIRRKFNEVPVEFSEHAFQRCVLRNIGQDEIAEVMALAEIIEEYPNDKYGPNYLLLGFTHHGRPLHLQVSTPLRPRLRIITAYQPDPAVWIDFLCRRATDTQ